jgi:hypothetical protein
MGMNNTATAYTTADDKALMSDAQYRAMRAVIERDGLSVQRYRDATVSTLLALANRRRGWAEIVWTTFGRERRITRATLTNAGRNRFDAETARRARVIEHQRRLDIALGRGPVVSAQGPLAGDAPAVTPAPRVAAADPFRVLVRPDRPAPHPDSPYGDEIPF